MPQVSVIMPSYNTAPFIAEAIDSVLAQDYRDFEIIVINDGSPDTPELERVLARYLDHIVYLKQENRRACGARNNGIRHAKGDYLAFLDSDDKWLPGYLRSQMRHFHQDPALDMIYCNCIIEGSGAQAGKTFMEVCPSEGPATFENVLLEHCQVPVSGVIARREAVMNAGLFDERLAMCDDYEMWLRLAYRGSRIAYYNDILAAIRIGRTSSLSASNARMLSALLTILLNVEAEWKLTPVQVSILTQKIEATRALLALEQGKEHLINGEVNQARVLLQQANAQLRRGKLTLALLGLRIAPGLTARAARHWEQLAHS